ncbi:cupin domain-containing protein [Aestuariibacter halophilus]|uniref:Cupin domain-containing protein n=1 Tax=Fluctibacter halophilus TaxID=226011 RepID=A0ABS8G728_9ALTE|nr:cupin domain-containing protein [Aestuariibacter halophilus]MCC2616355.1 cupin domain-containing protein [Aestuariibacter halophilus]
MAIPTLLRSQDIAALPGEHKTHFLNNNAQRLNKSLGDASGLTGLGVHLIEVQPGFDTTEYHAHYYEDECVYVLEGQALARVGNEETTLQAGDFIAYPAGGEPHSLHNNGNGVLRCLVIGQRLDHDVADYPDKHQRIFRQRGMPWSLVDIDALTYPRGKPDK